MNLFYLMSKSNKRFARSQSVEIRRLKWQGLMWRGVQIANEGFLIVNEASRCQPFRSRAATVGWYAQSLGSEATLLVELMRDGRSIASREVRTTGLSFEPIIVPWPHEPGSGDLDLSITCRGPDPVFLGCHFELDRASLVRRCKGKGLELGPGPNPHVRPDEQTDVRYVEQKAPSEWVRLYGEHYKAKFDPELEALYVIGEAYDLPANPSSLDFIYASHVFEHLANPLGHLARWSALLRPGGELVLVVPDFIGSKDFLADASDLPEILAEYEAGGFQPDLRHYERFARSKEDPGLTQILFEQGSSIHVHFYSNWNMQRLLEHSLSLGLFSRYSIIHCPNAKDFHVVAVR